MKNLPTTWNIEEKKDLLQGQDRFYIYINGQFFSTHPTKSGALELAKRIFNGE